MTQSPITNHQQSPPPGRADVLATEECIKLAKSVYMEDWTASVRQPPDYKEVGES